MFSRRLVRPLLTILRYNHRTVPYPDITHPEQTIRIPETYEEKLALPLERPRFIDEYSLKGPPYGRIYEKIPFKSRVEKGRAYLYCACGWANTQPFCDGMCKHVWGNHDVRRNPKFRPIKYVAEETKDVWWCNCKQAKKRPFCDGTHKLDFVTPFVVLDLESLMSENQFPMNITFMTASQKPIAISSTSIQRAEQIMSQAASKDTYDQFNDDDDIDDDELCRVCDECDELYNTSQVSQSQRQELNNIEQTQNNITGGLKRKRLGVSTTPKERRAMIKKH